MKQIGKTYVLKLRPDAEQKQKLNKWLWLCRRLYNATLFAKNWDYHMKTVWDDKKGRWALPKGAKVISEYDMIKKYQEIAKEDEDFDGLPAFHRNYVAKHVDQTFKNFFAGLKAGRNVGFPKFTTMRRYNTLRCNSVAKNKLNFDGNKVKLINLGFVKFHKDRIPPEDAKIKNYAITKKADGWYLSIYAEYMVKKTPIAPEPEVGIDMGVANYMALSTGELIENPKYTDKYARKLAKLQRNLARKKGSKKGEKKSNRYQKQAARVAKLHNKIANSRLDYQHKKTTEIVKRFQTIVIEDLKLQNMMASARGTVEKPGKNVRQKAGLNRSLGDAAIYQTRSLLEYKAGYHERTFKTVDPKFTSQTCSSCGYKDKSNRITQAKFVCGGCGAAFHADTNAAKNILKRSKNSLLSEKDSV